MWYIWKARNDEDSATKPGSGQYGKYTMQWQQICSYAHYQSNPKYR
jgi:hypothetical protein